MRRLLVLCAAVVLADTMFYAALTPLLPELVDTYDLSKAGAGLLVSAFAIGSLALALPSGLAASRLGPKVCVVAGLSLMSAASLAFALADSAWGLGAARFVQGLGSTLSWAGALTWLVTVGPRERRGQTLGIAISAAVVGALLGPVLGTIASAVGLTAAFVGVAILGAGLVAWTVVTHGAPAQPQPFSALRPVLTRPGFLGGLWLTLLPAFLFGVVTVLIPLELADLGWGAVAIGSVFLVGAGLEAIMHPLVGRYSDSRGRLAPMRAALIGSIAVSLALAWAGQAALIALLTLAALLVYGGFYAPAAASVADAAEGAGLAQGLAFGVVNAAWAFGNAVGPAAAGGLADVSGDALPFVVSACACFGSLVLLGRIGTHLARVPT
ncbi:MAG TPA: MFS transporter [Gaiellaceae bacterium]|jgi:MFS family permease